MTDWTKVRAYLIDCMADPYEKDVARTLIERIDANKIGIGRLLRRMVEESEKGAFK
jgi:triphosphoribosyl-dephospho-CoA synthetase